MQAIQIFEAKADREVRDTLAASVATQFGITSKAVRDIWKLRTWVQTTKPYWTQADHDDFFPDQAPITPVRGVQGPRCPLAV